MAMLLDVGGEKAVEAVRATPDSANLCPIRSNSKRESNTSDNGNTGYDDSSEGSDGDTSNAENLSVISSMTLLFSAVSSLFHIS